MAFDVLQHVRQGFRGRSMIIGSPRPPYCMPGTCLEAAANVSRCAPAAAARRRSTRRGGTCRQAVPRRQRKMAFTPGATSHSDETRWQLIHSIGPVMRYKLNDAKGAAELYRAAVSLIDRHEWRVACAVEAADAFLNDMLQPLDAKPLLDLASRRVAGVGPAVYGPCGAVAPAGSLIREEMALGIQSPLIASTPGT